MLVYWAIFVYFAAGALADMGRPLDLLRARPGWLFGALLIACMIGFRYEVGADWKTYGYIFSAASYSSFWYAISHGDPAFQALNWSVSKVGAEIVWVNVVCAILFTWGLFRLARTQPYPWLAILVALPYMVLVASMYTRQAAALGILMAGLATLIRGGSIARFVVYVALAATFHKTAIFVLPIVILSRPTNRIWNLVAGLAAGYVLYNSFLADSMDMFVRNYIKTGYSSQGAAIRIAMEVLAAAIFLFRRKDFAFPKAEDQMWFFFSLASIGAAVFLAISPSSTVVDRLSLYLVPLQVVVLSRLPLVYTSRQFGFVVILVYSAAVQFVWLNFANHAQYWLPYRFYPLFS